MRVVSMLLMSLLIMTICVFGQRGCPRGPAGELCRRLKNCKKTKDPAACRQTVQDRFGADADVGDVDDIVDDASFPAKQGGGKKDKGPCPKGRKGRKCRKCPKGPEGKKCRKQAKAGVNGGAADASAAKKGGDKVDKKECPKGKKGRKCRQIRRMCGTGPKGRDCRRQARENSAANGVFEVVDTAEDGVMFAVSPLLVYAFVALTVLVWSVFIYCVYAKECKGKGAKAKNVSVYDVDSENEVLSVNENEALNANAA